MINELDTIKKLEKSLADVSPCMCWNRFKLNISKTEFSVFSRRHQIAKCTVTSTRVDGVNIASYLIKYLGMWLDQHLTFNDHITSKCKIAMLNVPQTKFIRNYITQNTCIILMHCLLMSHLDYSNSLLVGVIDKAINKMHCEQNIAAQVVLKNWNKVVQVDKVWIHWLPLQG